jgi:D-alanyl-D-alanine carboxypeptidase/D-alanyl-D-alanine-endopeptidase (penicillin-binding protein 4)
MRSWPWTRALAVAAATASTCSIHTPRARSGQPEVAPPPVAAEARPPAPPPGADLDDRIEYLEERVKQIVATRGALLPGARVGVAIMDVQTGRMLVEQDADGLYNTASNTKLITGAAALALLGPDFRYYTALYGLEVDPVTGVLKGDLHMRGRGDPSLGTSELLSLTRELRQGGVRKIDGRIIIDTDYFDSHVLPPHFDEKPKDQAPYRAPINATALNFNAVSVSVKPAATGIGPCEIVIDPPNDYVTVEGSVETVTTGRSRIRFESTTTRDNLQLMITGQLRLDDGVKSYRRRVPDPVLYLGSALRAALLDSGIQIAKKRIVTGEVPKLAKPLAWRVSEPLAVLVRGLGKYSNNFVAEMLLKTIGAETRADKTKPATWDDGLHAVRGWLEGTIGWKADGYYYGNGSGLYASNRFSPRQLVQLLGAAYRDFRWGPDLMASLSIAGVDGTISRRMARGPAAGLVRAKTGTLDGVSTLSGYVATDGRAPLAFAVLVNGFTDEAADSARLLQNDVCEAAIPFLQAAAR